MNKYRVLGYDSRMDYLVAVADDMGFELDKVLALAQLLGADEDFDGLISMLEDIR